MNENYLQLQRLQRQYQLIDDENKSLKLQIQMLREELEQVQKKFRLVKICSICLIEFLPRDMYIVDQCNHKFCVKCLSTYITGQITEGNVHIKCPLCPNIIHSNEIKNLISSDMFEKYEEFSLNDAISGMQDIVWCPKCSVAYIQQPNQINNDASGFCQNCNLAFCFKCKKDPHPGFVCGELATLDEIKSEEWVFQNAKECPKCKRPIEKNGGCKHMTCKKCKYEFCWFCLGDYSQGSHSSCKE